jgi:hypothetical protein
MPKYVMVSSSGTEPAPAPLTVVTSSLPNGTVGTAYTQTTLSATGGTAPYTWSELELLPDGLTLSSAGVISGTPTAAGTFNVRVQVRDSLGSTADSGTMPVVIASANTLRITTANLANGRIQVPYSATLAAAGGTAPYTFSISSGALPTGLTLTGSTGTISGTPTVSGTFSVTFRVTDSLAATATSGSYQLVIDSARPLEIITVSPLNVGEVGDSYTRGLTATGGITPYTWAVSIGSLPAGLTLSSDGVISGTPSAQGTSTFTVTVTDSAANTTFKELALTINAAGTIEGPHDYFNELVASPYHYRSWHLRSTANIASVYFGLAGLSGHTTYVYPNDPFPDKQDAAKIVLPAGNANYEQLRMPISVGAEHLGVSSVSVLVTWDFYWDISFATENGNLEGYKSFQLSRHDAKIYFEPQNRFITRAQSVGGLSYFAIRGYFPVTFNSGHTKGGANAIGPDTGLNYGTDAIGPMENEFLVMPNKWTRMWATFTFTAGSTYATNINFWIADEDRDPVQILSGVGMFWPAKNNVDPGGLLHQLWIEFNSSLARPEGEWIAYVRNACVLRDMPDYLAYVTGRRPKR